MEGTRAELPHLSAIRGEGLVLELGEVNVLGFVDVNEVKGLAIKEEDSMFDMVHRKQNNTSKQDFFDNL